MRIEAIHGKSQQSTIECHEPIMSSCEAYEFGGANGREVRRVRKEHEPAPAESRKPDGAPRGARFKIGGNVTHPQGATAFNRIQIGHYRQSYLCAAPAEDAGSFIYLHNYKSLELTRACDARPAFPGRKIDLIYSSELPVAHRIVKRGPSVLYIN